MLNFLKILTRANVIFFRHGRRLTGDGLSLRNVRLVKDTRARQEAYRDNQQLKSSAAVLQELVNGHKPLTAHKSRIITRRADAKLDNISSKPPRPRWTMKLSVRNSVSSSELRAQSDEDDGIDVESADVGSNLLDSNNINNNNKNSIAANTVVLSEIGPLTINPIDNNTNTRTRSTLKIPTIGDQYLCGCGCDKMYFHRWNGQDDIIKCQDCSSNYVRKQCNSSWKCSNCV